MSNTYSQVRTPYFLYSKEKVDLKDRSFKRYIIPQLRAITQEYFFILKKLHPIHNSTNKLYVQISNAERTFKSFNQECTQINQDCLVTLKGLYLQTRKLDRLIMEPQSYKLSDLDSKSSHEIESVLDMFQSLGAMYNVNYLLMHTIEEYILTSNTSFFPYYDGRAIIEPSIHKMFISSELMLTQMLEGELKDDFHAVWMQFFREIDDKILYQKDKIFLLRRLEEMNIAWNTFHMKMTKGNHNLPKEIINLIKIMHNRWNSCLKIIFG